MDDTELVVPWEKQQRMLDASNLAPGYVPGSGEDDDGFGTPVRKSLSYAGVAVAGGSEATRGVAALRMHPNEHPSITPKFSVGVAGGLEGGIAQSALSPMQKALSTASDTMAAFFRAESIIKRMPFFSQQAGSTHSSSQELSLVSYIRQVSRWLPDYIESTSFEN